MPDIGDLSWEEIPGRRPIGDLVVLDFSLPRRVVDPAAVAPFWVILDAIRWISDHQLRNRARKQGGHQAFIPAVATRDAMGSELPDIARLGDRDLRDFRDLVLVGKSA